jgi:hypothetical protein
LSPLCILTATAWMYVPNWSRLHEACTRSGEGARWPVYTVSAILLACLAHRVLRAEHRQRR